jgi:DNA-3-methyladenine glycosylase II
MLCETGSMSTIEWTIVPRGPFSLQEAAQFGFGGREAHWDGVMRMAFCVDGYRTHAGVELRQDDRGVHAKVWSEAPVWTVRRQVTRVLSLDHDGEGFLEVGARDPIIGKLQSVAPGLRPPLFYSPYEAAGWAVISARRHHAQAVALRRRLNHEYGTTFRLADEDHGAFPTPERLLELRSFPGLTADQMTRLHGVAQAALEGLLDVDHLRALGPDAAMQELRRIRGIGPFYSALIVVRASGFADVLPVAELKASALVGELYRLGRPATRAQLEKIAEAWRPYRTWAVVLIRAAAHRIATASQKYDSSRHISHATVSV